MKSVRVLFAALFVLVLSPATAPAAPPLLTKPAPIGRWNLERWSDFVAAESTMRPWVAFKPNGALDVSDGCFNYTSHYRVIGTTLVVDKLDRLPGGCSSKTDRWFEVLTKFFPIELARQGGFNFTSQQLTFSTMGGEGFVFRSSDPAPSRAPPSSGARALVRSDFLRMDEQHECDPDLDQPTSIKIMCVAANQRLTNCRVDGPSSYELDRAAQCLARMSKLKPGIDGPVTFKIGAR
jgi:hypothetical protein